jgi:hypothetical protein
MVALDIKATRPGRQRGPLLAALIVVYAVASAYTVLLVPYQAPGADFSVFWAAARLALNDPGRLYDFAYISAFQGWPLGPGNLRPYIYPPSALFFFAPLALAPYWISYGLWVVVTGGLFVWSALKARIPWWFVLMPPIAFVAFCGQVTFLIGGLVLMGLALRDRPLLSGVLLGAAAAVKPQLLLLAPIALLAEARWKTLGAAGLTGLTLVGASALVWGVDTWRAWLTALGRFHTMIFQDPTMVVHCVTPYAALELSGLNGNWAFLLAPAAVASVWIVFRRSQDIAVRLLTLMGGAIAIAPYAMQYETALLAPAVAAILARTDERRWLALAGLSAVYAVGVGGFATVAAAITMPLLAMSWPSAEDAPWYRRLAIRASSEGSRP